MSYGKYELSVKKANKDLISLTQDFSIHEMFAYRKWRDWEFYNKLTQLDKLYYIKKEVETYIRNYK